jgi:SAM-dependent methyltransferase
VTTGQREGSYLFKNALDSEAERLRLPERIADPRSERLLTDAGIGPGWDCAEVGAGGGSVARWMVERVGSTGSVLALDLDTALLDDLRDLPHVTVQEADLTTTPLPRETFDLVHTRNLLMHLPDRERILGELFAATRPGGMLVVEEADGFPVSAATDETFRRTVEPLTRRWQWARSLPSVMAGLGLTEMSILVDTEMPQGGTDLAAFWHHTLRTALPLLEPGTKPAEEDVAKTLEMLEDPDFWTLFMAVVCVTGRKPQ